MTVSEIRKRLEELRDALESGSEVDGMFKQETPEIVADTVGVMADLASSLSMNVVHFFQAWDFEEDCRRGREKEAAVAGGA